MAQTLERTYPDEWVTRMVPAIIKRAEQVEGHRVIQEILEARGATPDEDGKYSVEDLTTMQKAEIMVDLFFWKEVQRYEVELAQEQAHAAAQAAMNDPVDGGA